MLRKSIALFVVMVCEIVLWIAYYFTRNEILLKVSLASQILVLFGIVISFLYITGIFFREIHIV